MFDTEMPVYQFWREICEDHGCPLPLETWVACIGGSNADFDPCQYLEAQSKRPFNRDEIDTRVRTFDAKLVTSLPLLPGVLDYIHEAKQLGLKLAVASNSGRQWVFDLLTHQGIAEHFDCLICSEDATQLKPHPELYQRALTALELRPEEVIALEDSPNGIRAAKAAGIFCVAVPNILTGQLPLDHADMRLVSLEEIPLHALLEHVQSIKGER